MSNVARQTANLEWPSPGGDEDNRITRSHEQQDGEDSDDRSGLD
jgi:hypothetical protein